MRKVLFAVLGLLAVLVAIAAALPFIISADFVARQITDLVHERTGRELTMAGAPGFSFYPEFAVELHEVTLGNPPEMAAGAVIEAESLRARVALLPLLSSRLEVEELVLESPNLKLLIDKQGRSNWSFAEEQPAEAEAQQVATDDPDAASHGADATDDIAKSGPVELPIPVKFAPIEIRNGAVTFDDERNATSFTASDVNVVVKLPTLQELMSVKGTLIWRNQKVSIDAAIRRPEDLAAGRASPIDLSLNAPLLTIGYDGQFSLEQGPSLAGVVGVSTPSLRELAQWLGSPLAPGRGLGQFSAEGAIGFHHHVLTLKDAEIGLDGMHGRGTMRLEFDGPRPKVLATLGIDILDLNNYLDPVTADDQEQPSGLTVGWSTEPFDFSGLRAVDANLTLNVGHAVLGRTRSDAGGLRILLEDGVFEAQLNDLSLYGGTAAGNVELDATKNVPHMRLALSGRDFDGYSLLRDFAGLAAFEGRGAATISLQATGKSQAAMIGTLRGRAIVQLTDGALRSLDVPALVRNVAGAMVDGWQPDAAKLTDFSLLEASFDIENGVAANEDLVLVAPTLRVNGEGSIDLIGRVVDYRVEPVIAATLQPKDGDPSFEGFGTPIVVKGPWSAPRIYPDIDGILQDPKAAYGKFKGLVKAIQKPDQFPAEGLGTLINRETSRILGAPILGGAGEQVEEAPPAAEAPEPTAPEPEALAPQAVEPQAVEPGQEQ